MSDYWHEVEFVIGLEAKKTGSRIDRINLYDTWVTQPRGSVDPDVRLFRVKLEVPESNWKLPVLRGKVKSELKQEYEMFVEEMQ